MEVAVYMIGVAATALAIISGVLGSGGHRYAALWLGCLAICLYVIAGSCWLHDLWQKADAASTVHPAVPAKIDGDPPKTERKKTDPPKTDAHTPMANMVPIVANAHVTPEYIFKTIDDAPPLARDTVAKQFIGVPVSWDGELFHSQNMDKGLVRLVMKWKTSMTAFSVDVEISKYPFLLQAKDGTVLHVEGIIQGIQLQIAYLKNATIALKAEPPIA